MAIAPIRSMPSDRVLPPTPDIAVLEGLTDTAHAQRFAEAHGDRLRYLHDLGTWLLYRDPIWRIDRDGGVIRLAMAFARTRQREALEIPNRETRERVVQFAIRCESKPNLDRLIALAKSLPPITDTSDDWDANPWLVGAPNGVIDLKSSRLLSGSPARKITLAVSVPFDDTARAPRFEQFLLEIFDGDPEMISFLQRYCGYALSGDTSEQKLVIAHGMGSNGKSVLLGVLSHVFGEYAQNMPFSTIEMRGRSSIPNDLAMLRGKRLITASETNDGTRLNESRLKALTGGDAMTARFLYSESFTFRPTGKFLIAVNHKPLVHDDGEGFWRRMLLVPFLRSFTGAAKDTTLEATLRLEAPGILAWLVTGCRMWQVDGLREPSAVLQATERYREDSDPIADFLSEYVDLVTGENARASAVQSAYQKWADKQGLTKTDRLSSKALGQRLSDRFTRRHDREGWMYEGIRIATERMF
jgi:putative DNA primase/helicase